MPKVIEKEDPQDNTFMNKVASFVTLKRRIADMDKERSSIQSELSDIVDEEGEPDEKGHIWLKLPFEVDGVTSLQRQRKVSQSLNEESANSILSEKGLSDRCYKMIPVLDEAEVMACLYEGLLAEDDIDAMFTKKVSYAFYTK
jgi:hypothetical protein